MPAAKTQAFLAIILGLLMLILPAIVMYAAGLALIAWGINELFPELKTQVLDYFRGGGRPRP
jgi:hypothetical protein